MLGRTAPLPSWVFSLATSSCNSPGWKPHISASDTNLKEAIEGGVGDVRVAPEHLRLHHQPRLLREPKPCTIYFPYSAHSEENSQLLEFLTRVCRSLEALSWRGPLQLREPCQLNQNIFLYFNDTTFKVTKVCIIARDHFYLNLQCESSLSPGKDGGAHPTLDRNVQNNCDN